MKKSTNGLKRNPIDKYYTKIKVICLGGIKQNNLNKIKLLKVHGFSSVSLFKQNIKYISL